MVKIFSDIEQMNFFAAENFVGIADYAINRRGRFTVALSGGSTPKSLFRLLTSEKFSSRIDWSKTFFFFGDERNVLPDNTESNFRMASENLFQTLKIADENIFCWQTELGDAEKIAEDYERKIIEFFNLKNSNLPRFDLILLGMGADGHTASLFPFSPALFETEKIAVANPVEKLNTTRLTLTFPVINNAANIIFLVSGAEKAAALKEILEGKRKPEKFPAQNVQPKNGNLLWLLDEKSAALLG
ncbi:MAG: 6-phosphogluconolactonase [Pyrinomonadaceae bacterium]